jgi:hypothetical protein
MSRLIPTYIEQALRIEVLERAVIASEKDVDQLERELVEAREQLRLCNIDQFTTAAELAEAVAKERERCAKVSEEYPGALHSRQEELMAYDIAAAIRKGE